MFLAGCEAQIERELDGKRDNERNIEIKAGLFIYLHCSSIMLLHVLYIIIIIIIKMSDEYVYCDHCNNNKYNI